MDLVVVILVPLLNVKTNLFALSNLTLTTFNARPTDYDYSFV
jgi:hypothetical protein